MGGGERSKEGDEEAARTTTDLALRARGSASAVLRNFLQAAERETARRRPAAAAAPSPAKRREQQVAGVASIAGPDTTTAPREAGRGRRRIRIAEAHSASPPPPVRPRRSHVDLQILKF